MAHVMKMTKGAVGHMFKHYERGKDEKGEYIKFGNEDIDKTRTHLNYNLAPEQSQGDFIKQRCSEVKCLNRKDVNVACSWVVTLPKDFNELNQGKDPREFFEGTYQFLENRYGKKNVVSAYVHMDETSPHIHFCFVPVVFDKDKGQFKLSAKEAVDRYDLQTFHNDLQKDLSLKRGLYANVLNMATIEGNKSIEELKRGTAIDKLNEVYSEVSNAKMDMKILECNKKALEGQIQSLEGKVLTLQEVNQVKIKKPLLGSQKTVIQMPYQDAINLQKTAQKVGEVDNLLKSINQEKEELHQARLDLVKQREEVSRIPMKKQMEYAQLRDENNKLRSQISRVNAIVEKRPDLFKELQKEAHKNTPTKEKTINKGFSRER